MQLLHPREVDRQAPLRWWRQALALVLRRPGDWALLVAAQIAAAGFSALMPDLPALLIGFASNLAIIAAGTRLAAAADGRRREGRGMIGDLCRIGGLGILLLLFEVAVTGWLLPAPLQEAADKLLVTAVAPGAAGAIQLGLPLTWSMWLSLMSCGLAFLPALCLVLADPPRFRIACLLSLMGAARNLPPYIIALSLPNLMLAVLPFGAVGAPLMTAVSYVAFRDIFLGIAENARQERVAALHAAAVTR